MSRDFLIFNKLAGKMGHGGELLFFYPFMSVFVRGFILCILLVSWTVWLLKNL